MLNKKFKKAISAVTMFATVVCLSGVSMLAPLSVKAATTIVDGDIIKSNATNSDGTPTIGSLDVYIVKTVGTKKFKRLVLNPQVFTSYGHLKWSNLKTVSQAEEDAYTTSDLVRVDGSDKVYALTPAGDTGAKSWINVTADQFINGAGSDADSIYTINSVDAGNYTAKGDITTVAQLKAFYKDGTLPAGAVSGDLTVSLAATTPESTNVPTDSMVNFTEAKLAAGSSAVTINSITVSANGLGADSAITGLALYVDGSKVGTSKSNAAGVMNSSRQATFNFSTPIAIAANASKTLAIKATVHVASTYVVGIKSATDIITAGGSVGGTFPIWGNAMSSVVNASLGTVTLNAVNGTDLPGTNFGTDNVLLAGFNLLANNEAAILSSLRFKNGGNNADGIISNLKLFIDGEDVADGTYDAATGYVEFNIDANYKIKKSGTVSVEVYGDMGSSTVGNTISLYLKSKDDVVFTGETYGFGVQLTDAGFANLDTVAEGITVTMATGDVTIDMDKAVTPAKDVKAGDTGVVLGTFSVTSNGENATINQIASAGANFQIQGTLLAADKISNVVMVDTTSGSTYDVAAVRASDAAWNLTMGDEIPLVKGVKKTFEIKADLADDIATNATLKVYVAGAGITITGDASDAPITNITPANVTSSIATVKAASLDWTTGALSNKSVVPGAKDVVVYQASLEAGSAADIKLSTVTLTNETAAANSFTDANITKIDLFLAGKLIKTVTNQIVEGNSAYVTFNSLIATDSANVIKKGTVANLEAKATFASSLTSSTFNLGIDSGTTSIVARDADNTTVVENVVNAGTGSRTITTTGQGTLKVELLTSDSAKTRDNVLLAGTANGSGKYLGELKFTTANEKITLTELRLVNTGTATSSSIAEVQLVDSTGAVKASKIPAAGGNVIFTGLTLDLAADQATSYYIAVKAKGMNVDGDASSTAVQNATAIYDIAPVNGVVATGADSGLPITLASDTMAGAAAQVDTLTLSGASGTASVSCAGVTRTATYATSTTVTATNFVTANAAAYLAAGITLTSNTADLIFTATTAGVPFSHPTITNLTTNLAGTIVNTTPSAGTTSGVTAGEWTAANVKTKTAVISGSVLNSITNAMTDASLTPGVENIVAKYTFTFDNGSNRTTTNDELKAILKNMTLTQTGTNLASFASVGAYIEGTSTRAASGTGGTTFVWTNLDSLSNSGKVDGAVTLVIVATPTLTAPGNATMQTKITTDTNFGFIGAGEGSTVNSHNYLTDDTITGATLRYSA